MDYQVAYNPTTKVALLQDVGDVIPAGSTNIGTITKSASEPLSAGVRDLLYNRSCDDPSELASWPDNITDMRDITITFSDGTIVALALTAQTLTNGADGVTYTFQVGFTGGVPAYVFSLVTPPSGCTINSHTGLVTFVTPAADDYDIAVRLTDGAGTIANRTYALTVV